MRDRLAKFAVAAVLLAGLAACVNPYSAYYEPIADPNNTVPILRVYPAQPQLGSGSGAPQKDVLRMFQEGYGLIGRSRFVAENGTTETLALDQAKKVGATLALVSSLYRNSVATNATHTTVETKSSGSETKTETDIDSDPEIDDFYSVYALYFAPMARAGIGFAVLDATDAQKSAAGTNRVVQIVAIRKDSPAFNADILAGDLLLAIDGKEVADIRSATAALRGVSINGATVSLRLFRDSRRITKTVKVPAGDW